MDFGRLASVDPVQFVLPPMDARFPFFSQGTKEPGKTGRLRVGAPIWSCPEWVGGVYPPGTRPKDFLKHYSRWCESIELNSTFYGIPSDRTIAQWREAVPDDFKFVVKLPQTLSHGPNLVAQSTLWRSLQGFGDRLGMVFLQLPPGWSVERFPELERFLDSVPSTVQIAVEFRHTSWFQHQRLRYPVYELFRHRGVSVVISDVAGRRDVLHASLPVPRVMIRFVGNEQHPSDRTRLQDWKNRIREWFDHGVQEIDFFIHQKIPENMPVTINAFRADCAEWLAARSSQGLFTRSDNSLGLPGVFG